MATFDMDALDDTREKMRWAARRLRETRDTFGTYPFRNAKFAWKQRTAIPKVMLGILVGVGFLGWSFVGVHPPTIWAVISVVGTALAWFLILASDQHPQAFFNQLEHLDALHTDLENSVTEYLKLHKRTYMETDSLDDLFDDG